MDEMIWAFLRTVFGAAIIGLGGGAFHLVFDAWSIQTVEGNLFALGFSVLSIVLSYIVGAGVYRLIFKHNSKEASDDG